jgi:transcriptional regulator with XRE-family HTH domain
MATTLKERLALAMKGPPVVTQAALARVCEVSPPSVSDWLSGKTKTLAGMNLVKAARLLNVNPEWLGTGRGPMRLNASAQPQITENFSHPLMTSESQPAGISVPILHQALTLLEHEEEQVAERYKISPELARTERLAELYRRVEANGGRLDADGYKQLGREIDARRGEYERVHGKRRTADGGKH